MTQRDPNDTRNFVIVGGGAAGLNCAETLRQSGFTGKITLISGEKVLPYDRTLLTKALPVGDAKKFALRDEQFLKDHGIDIVYDKLYAIHADKKMLTFARGQPMAYEKLLVATGGLPREAKWIKGIKDAKNVFNLRDAADQEKIKEKAKTVKDGVAILGSSFIGSEAAASLRMKYKDQFDIHMIGLEEYPIEKVFGKEIGKMMANEHTKHGVTLHMQKDIKEIIKNSEGEIEAIILDDGTEHKVSMLICGLGILPQTKFLEKHETGIKTDRQGAIVCDPFLESSVKDIYAAGDICAFPYWQTGQPIRVEHWIHAMDQGSYAAFNMLGKFVPYGNTPFFWTRHYNKSMQYVGHCVGYDEVIVHGDVNAQKFIAYYVKDNRIQAVSGMGMSGAVLTMFEAFNQNKVPSADDIRSGTVTPETLRSTMKLTAGRGCTREGCCSKPSAQAITP